MPDTILEEDHPRIISTKFGWDWLSSFRGEDFSLISSPLFLFLAWYTDPPLPMVYWTPYPWYIDPPIHGILTPLPIEYQPPYTWYFDLTAYLLIRNGGGGVKIPWGFNLLYRGGSIYHGCKLTQGSKYHTTPGASQKDVVVPTLLDKK